MTTVMLSHRATVILNALGNGTAQAGPISPRETWMPSQVSVNTNEGGAPVNDAQCQIFVGNSPTADNFRDGTFTGSSGDSTDRVSGDVIHTGQYVWAVWTGGDAGAQAIMAVIGTKEV